MSVRAPIRLGWVGAGGVTQALSAAFARVECPTVGVYSRKPLNKKWLSDSSLWVKNPQALMERHCDVLWIAVPDDAIAAVAQGLSLPADTLSVHLSGTTPLSAAACAQKGTGYGVFYPLQSCSGGRPNHFGDVPIGIAASNQQVADRLFTLAGRLGAHPFYAKDDARLHLHLAATMAANFSNHLLAQVAQYLEAHKADFSMLAPLMQEVIAKAFAQGPHKAQTGAAIRGDQSTIKRHQQLLSKYAHPFLRQLYDAFTEHIQHTYAKKNKPFV